MCSYDENEGRAHCLLVAHAADGPASEFRLHNHGRRQLEPAGNPEKEQTRRLQLSFCIFARPRSPKCRIRDLEPPRLLLFRILPRVVRLVPSNRTIERGAVVAASTRDAEVAGPELLSLCGGAGRGRRGQTSTRAGYAPINGFERPPNRMLRAAVS